MCRRFQWLFFAVYIYLVETWTKLESILKFLKYERDIYISLNLGKLLFVYYYMHKEYGMRLFTLDVIVKMKHDFLTFIFFIT